MRRDPRPYVAQAQVVPGGTLHPGIVTVVQRFRSNLGLYVHLHCLVTDGAFEESDDDEGPQFRGTNPLGARDQRAMLGWSRLGPRCDLALDRAPGGLRPVPRGATL